MKSKARSFFGQDLLMCPKLRPSSQYPPDNLRHNAHTKTLRNLLQSVSAFVNLPSVSKVTPRSLIPIAFRFYASLLLNVNSLISRSFSFSSTTPTEIFVALELPSLAFLGTQSSCQVQHLLWLWLAPLPGTSLSLHISARNPSRAIYSSFLVPSTRRRRPRAGRVA